jgi:hypothetical protein
LLSKADTGVRRPAETLRGEKQKNQEYACNRKNLRQGLFWRTVIRVSLMTETGDRQHGKGSRQSDCPVSDMIDLPQCSLAVDAVNLF